MVGAAGDRDLRQQAVLLLIASANSLQSARYAARYDRFAGMQFGDFLDLVDGITSIAFQRDLADRQRAARRTTWKVRLIWCCCSSRCSECCHFRLVEAIFLHHSLDAGKSAVEFLLRSRVRRVAGGVALASWFGEGLVETPSTVTMPTKKLAYGQESAAGRRQFRCDRLRPEYRRNVRWRKEPASRHAAFRA